MGASTRPLRRLAGQIRKAALAAATARALPTAWRVRMLRAMGADLHPTAKISYGVLVAHADRLHLAEHSHINVASVVDGDGHVHLAPWARVGPRCLLLTTGHTIAPDELRLGPLSRDDVRDIRIGRGAWIGAGSILLPGVAVAPGCVVGAGSVVTRDTEPNGLYAGNPARRLRDLDTPGDPTGPTHGTTPTPPSTTRTLPMDDTIPDAFPNTIAQPPADALDVARLTVIHDGWLMQSIIAGGLFAFLFEVAFALSTMDHYVSMTLFTWSIVAVAVAVFAVTALLLRSRRNDPIGTRTYARLAAAALDDPETARAAVAATPDGRVPSVAAYNAIAADHEDRRHARIRRQSGDDILRAAKA